MGPLLLLAAATETMPSLTEQAIWKNFERCGFIFYVEGRALPSSVLFDSKSRTLTVYKVPGEARQLACFVKWATGYGLKVEYKPVPK